MKLDFHIGGAPAQFTRGWFLGGMKVVTPHETVWLQRPLDVKAHFSISLFRQWQGWLRFLGQISCRDKWICLSS
ncbi:MAG: hypothetical protein ACRET0_05990 [Steroidobacteraceae bacterium]